MSLTGNLRAPERNFTGSGHPLEAREQKIIQEYVRKRGKVDNKLLISTKPSDF
jgi:hypothetical protein